MPCITAAASAQLQPIVAKMESNPLLTHLISQEKLGFGVYIKSSQFSNHCANQINTFPGLIRARGLQFVTLMPRKYNLRDVMGTNYLFFLFDLGHKSLVLQM